jgi:hypothetical protein
MAASKHEREQRRSICFIQKTLDRSSHQPSDRHAFSLGYAIQFNLLDTRQRGGDAFGVLTVLAHAESSAAFRGVPRQYRDCA